MSLSPVRFRTQSIPHETRYVLENAISEARSRLRTRRLLKAALVSLPLLVLVCVIWVLVVRYTFVDVPPWAVVVFPAAWLLGLLVVHSRIHVSVGEAARFLDSTLELDERVSTSVELIRSGPVSRLRGGRILPEDLIGDAAHHLNLKIYGLPSSWRISARSWQLLLPLLLVVPMIMSIVLPTPIDAIRAQRAEMQAVAQAELDRVAQFKAQIVDRPGMTDDAKQRLLDELGTLEAAIKSAGTDRSALLAALNDAQERLQALAPGALSDFDGLVAAARTVQQATANAVRNASPDDVADWTWNPADYPDLSDLAKAADAADVLAGRTFRLTSRQVGVTTPRLERASAQAASTDAQLGQYLLNSANAINVKDAERATDSLKAVAAGFRSADGRYNLASSVEQMMSGLDTGRQKLAETGVSAQKRTQVGFRRPGSAASGPSPSATGTEGTPTDDSPHTGSVSLNDPSALGPKMGSNSPSYAGQPTSGSGGAPASGVSGSGGAGSQGTQPGQDGAGGNPGGTAGGGQSDQQGTLSGQVTGPVGGGGGAISQVPNPAGQGVGSAQTQGQSSGSAEQNNETLYLPQDQLAITDNSGSQPTESTTPPTDNQGVQGRVSGAGDGPTTEGSRGPGSRVQVRVPYKEVIGQYAQQATQALDQVYIPSDAKAYVKQYFTELGK